MVKGLVQIMSLTFERSFLRIDLDVHGAVVLAAVPAAVAFAYFFTAAGCYFGFTKDVISSMKLVSNRLMSKRLLICLWAREVSAVARSIDLPVPTSSTSLFAKSFLSSSMVFSC